MISTQPGPCPDENELMKSLHGLLTPNSRAELERHLDQCDRCRSLVATVVRVSVKPEDELASDEEPTPTSLPRGTNLGRYVLLDFIGRGGMAMVYAAFDPELDRKVAVKLLRTDLRGAPAELRASLLREAQSMAQLTHPHVIAVYDVGTFNDQVFLAMEFIRGRDLRAWLSEARRSWTEILEIFLKAGEGLRAAHDSGLVHRDFKPDNVLVGHEGQVRVTDFGLAHRLPPPGGEDSASKTAPPALDRSVLAGTPLYIAPEQWRGEVADARSDQFSFCVSLYEAVYSARPYPGKTSATYGGVVPPPPKGSAVPGWVRRVLVKGLSLKPEDRHASMHDLLGALSRGLNARKYRAWVGAAALILFALSFAVEQAVESSARRAVEADLGRATQLFRVKATERLQELDTRAQAALKKDFLSEALGKADDLDARLGLAAESEDQGIGYSHDLLLSADMPLLDEEDVVLFVDPQGRVIYNRADEKNFGAKPVGLDILDLALEGTPAEALWSPAQVTHAPLVLTPVETDKDLLLLFARPVTRGRKTLGALVFGRWVKDSFLPKLEQSVGDRVVLRGPDRSQVATIDGDLKPIERLSDDPGPVLMTLGRQRALVQSVELAGLSGAPLGRAFLVRNFDDQVQPILWRFRRDALKYGALGILSLVALYMFWRARSRRKLVASAARPESGATES
jgi:anti-sigma factor RsiW